MSVNSDELLVELNGWRLRYQNAIANWCAEVRELEAKQAAELSAASSANASLTLQVESMAMRIESLAEELAKPEYAWAALYQGRPRPKGGKIFHEPTFYTKLPTVFRGAFGVDLAYTERTNADWSICVELWRVEQGKDETGKARDPIFYVKHVDHHHEEHDEHCARCLACRIDDAFH